MKKHVILYACALLLCNASSLQAQRVLYSPYMEDRSMIRFDVAGKSGDYYWIQKEIKTRNGNQRQDWWYSEGQSLEVYDERMRLVNTIDPFAFSDAVLKEYLVAGDEFFDRVMVTGTTKKTTLWVERFNPDGEFPTDQSKIPGEPGSNGSSHMRTIGSFPFRESGNSFIMVRSADKSKTLLLGFESIPATAPRMHAMIFDQDWRQLSYTIYTQRFISQPMIQDDFIGYPLEDFSNCPVKIANNGQWLMLAPSRTYQDFLLFHFCGSDNGFSYKSITLPVSTSLEEAVLSIDNEHSQAFAGILAGYGNTDCKNVRVTHYSMPQESFDFDSSFRFNTLAGTKMKKENLEKESFMAVPGKGLMLLKEYGMEYLPTTDEDEGFDAPWTPEFLFADNSVSHNHVSAPRYKINRNGYTRVSALGGMRNTFDRGDLCIFYFPASKGDSCWGGMFNKEQITELNTPSLSYLAQPINGRLFFLYNSFIRNTEPYSTSSVLDQQGHLIQDEGMVFWRVSHTLRFQQARQITDSEVAVPYEKDQRRGFAIIRF